VSTEYQEEQHNFKVLLGSAALGPVSLLRWIQLRVHNWFKDMEASSGFVAVPNFSQLFNNIKYQETAWYPLLPFEIRQQMQLAGVPSTQASTGASDDTASTAGSTLSGSSRSSSSGISALTGNTQPKAENVANLTFNPAFERFQKDKRQLRKIRGEHPYPANVVINGTPRTMCLSYHLKEHCNTNCGRKSDHEVHDAATDQILLAWANKVYAESS
jgi:hypothetical protein